MAEIRWTPQSVDDLEAICEFISRDSSRYAQSLAESVVNAIERLRLFPLSGRVVPEKSQDDIREVILGNYRIIYRLHEEMVEILTIHHSARLLDSSILSTN